MNLLAREVLQRGILEIGRVDLSCLNVGAADSDAPTETITQPIGVGPWISI